VKSGFKISISIADDSTRRLQLITDEEKVFFSEQQGNEHVITLNKTTNISSVGFGRIENEKY
jgi:hypothetical protein